MLVLARLNYDEIKKKGSKNLTEAFQTSKQISNRNKLKPDKISAVFPALPSTQNDRYQCFARSMWKKV